MTASLGQDVPAPSIERAIAEDSFHWFVRFAWHTIEPGAFVDGQHIRLICEHLQTLAEEIAGETPTIRREIICLPPRHMKSRLVSIFWPAWCWTRWPHLRFLFSSHTDALSTDHAVNSRRVIESDWYRSLWSDWKLESNQNVKHYFVNSKGGFRFSTSTGGSVTGFGGDILVVDDAIDTRHAQSEITRKTATEWYKQTWQSRVNNPRNNAKIVLGHRVHESDLAGNVLAEADHGYRVLCLPAEFESNHPQRCDEDWRREEGEVLWPEMFDAASLSQTRRDVGSYAYAGQYQQRPAPVEGGLLQRDWFKSWLRIGPAESPAVIPSRFDRMCISVDCTFKDAADSDFVVFHAWGRKGPNFYLVDQMRGRWGFGATLTNLTAFLSKHPNARPVYIEEAANGFAVIEELRRKVPGIVAVPPARLGGKIVRVNAVSPYLESGNVFIPDPSIAAWVDAFIEECCAFPNGAHDDQVDGMTLALIALTRGVGAAQGTAKVKGI